ncbi:hypothetical protein PY365_26900 [Roseiarcaceae bacterium H3SJ34-1]|uniref:hypothetical protein n=1 Tax=Terripilifer ovatus TaxID=3032367 RepID=UPI003AB9549A|nr:hypothetical protein [Roseiarcaceae bacterium H3SJ34-1]
MSKHNLMLIIAVAVAALAIGRLVVSRGPTPSAESGAPADQNEAAKAASRAMTFTQRKAAGH